MKALSKDIYIYIERGGIWGTQTGEAINSRSWFGSNCVFSLFC